MLVDAVRETEAVRRTREQGALCHIAARLSVLDIRVRRTLELREEGDPAAGDPLRGLFLSTDDVRHALDGDRPTVPPLSDRVAQVEQEAASWSQETGLRLPLHDLQGRLGLDLQDTELLLAAAGPDLDPRLERLYAFLNDDVGRRRASVLLLLELLGTSSLDVRARARLRPGSPLVDAGLIAVQDPERPWLLRGVTVPDRVVAHLLGSTRCAPEVDALVIDDLPDLHDVPAVDVPVAGLVWLQERRGDATRVAAVAGCRRVAPEVLVLDLSRLDASSRDDETLAAAIALEVALTGAAVVAGPVDVHGPAGTSLVRRLAGLPTAVVLHGAGPWPLSGIERTPVVRVAPGFDREQRAQLWESALPGASGTTAPQLRLAPEHIQSAARACDTAADAPASARTVGYTGSVELARRTVPDVGWDDLVLPEPVAAELHHLASRARHRDTVLETWRVRRGSGRGRGVTALFAGEPGTGKTLAAEVLAADLGVELYTVDLSSVVDKYVGETEKNLDRVFSQAEDLGAVLLFDEADALFGRRSGVSDARDRSANLEVAYLLQRMESFDGVAVLTTNLRANLDDAFTRRLDVVVTFPLPDAGQRTLLWRTALRPPVPLADGVDLAGLARDHDLAGGAISSAATTAAYVAVASHRPVTQEDLVHAVAREYRKSGRLAPSQHR